MMLFKLSIKNITKSIKDYAIYFFTLVLGVAIFYVFNAIDSQTVMLNVSSSTSEIIRLMTTILGGVSVFVSFILGFLIIYASRFLIKRRNKEFGIYLTLGMSKRKISLILSYNRSYLFRSWPSPRNSFITTNEYLSSQYVWCRPNKISVYIFIFSSLKSLIIL